MFSVGENRLVCGAMIELSCTRGSYIFEAFSCF
jgi:hypothetical protein